MHIGGNVIETGWLTGQVEPPFVAVHSTAGSSRDTAVLMVPPFGWLEALTYRPWREWADALGAAGYPAARLTLPGCGDSAGAPTDPHRIAAWTTAITETAGWLRRRTDVVRVVALGIGLGGLLAIRALADGAEIDDLALWATPATGRRWLREMKAYAAVLAANEAGGEGLMPPLPTHLEGGVELAGYVLSADTVVELERMSVAELAIPAAPDRRVLLLERETLGVDAAVRKCFERVGSDVTVAPAGSYQELMLDPRRTVLPEEAVAATLRWLGGRTSASRPGVGPIPSGPGPLELSMPAGVVRESVLDLDIGEGDVRGFGILSEPANGPRQPLTAVLLNPGVINHTGQSRIWVELARRWASRGICVVRIDVEGIGEAGGDVRTYVEVSDLYRPELVEQIRAALRGITDHDLPTSLIVLGACSGAYGALKAALAEPSVVAVSLINLPWFEYTPEIIEDRQARRYTSAMLAAARRRVVTRDLGWQQARTAWRLLRDRANRSAVARKVESQERAAVVNALDLLRDRGAEVLLLLSEQEAVRDELSRYGWLTGSERWPQLTIELLTTRDHTYRAIAVQQAVHDSLDRACERTIARIGTALESRTQ